MFWGLRHDWLSLAVALLVQTVSILKGGSFDCSAGVYRFYVIILMGSRVRF